MLEYIPLGRPLPYDGEPSLLHVCQLTCKHEW